MTNSKIGKVTPSYKSPLPYTLKTLSSTRQDIQSWRRALQMFQNTEQPTNWVLQQLYKTLE